MDADLLDRVAGVDNATLDAAGRHGPAALDAEDVLNRHQERLVRVAGRGRDVAVDRVEQLLDRGELLGGLIGAGRLESLERRAADDRDVVPGELVLAEELAHLHLDQVDEHLVVDHVDLVEVHDQCRHLDLASQDDVLAGLGHRSICGRNHQDGAVHLGSAGDHVLDVVSVTGAVHVRVVAIRGLVLDVGDRDGDAPRPLLGSVVDAVEGTEVGPTAERQVLRDRRGQGGLAVVDMTDGADVHVRLAAVELLLGHWFSFVTPDYLRRLALGLRDQLVCDAARNFCVL